MRPDEHKKRKNAQYKKAHGIERKSEGVKSAKQKDKNSLTSQNDGTRGKNEESKKEAFGSGKKEQPNHQIQKNTDDHSSSEENENVRQFRRRPVVSNWSRYEDLSAEEGSDEEITQRGEDFNKLLAQAGGSAAQFRFKDEEDWIEEREPTEAMLVLDLEGLSQSLSCIPLHERLSIEEKLFNSDQKKELIKEASKHQENHKPVKKLSSKTYSKDASRGKEKPESKSHAGMKTKVKPNASSAVTANLVGKDLKSDEKRETSTKTSCSNVNGNSDGAKFKSHNRELRDNQPQSKTRDVLELEDDLDALLEQDDSLSVTSKQKFLSAYRNTEVKERPVDKAVISQSSKDSAKSPVKSTKAEDNNSLEDWLDTMLDD